MLSRDEPGVPAPAAEARIAAAFVRASRGCSAALVALGASFAIVPISPDAAALFALLGVGLWHAVPTGSPRVRAACALAVMSIAALTAALGRTPLATSACFALAGAALLAARPKVVALVASDTGAGIARRTVDDALRERELHYRDLYENSPDLYASVDAENERILDCNRTLLTALGYEKHEVIGAHVGVLYHDHHRDAKSDARRQFAESGEVHDVELALQRKDGSKLDVSLNVTSLRDATGRIVSARTVWRDVSARKQADRDRRFLADLSDLLRNSSDPHEVMGRLTARLAQHLRASRGLFIEVDPARDAFVVQREYAADVAPMKGAHRLSAFSVETFDELRGGRTTINRDTSRDSRTAPLFESVYRPLGVHAVIAVPLRLEGELAALLAVAADAPRDWQEREVALLQIVGERTWVWAEQLRATEALRASEARKAAILDSSFAAIVSIDHRGAIVEFNPAAERLFGFDRAAVLGRSMAELIVPPALRAAHERGLARYLEQGIGPVIGRTVELPALNADGVELPVEIAITPVVGGATPMFTASIREVRDHGVEERVAERTTELLNALSERESLLQEVHQRVGDNLSVISNLIDMQSVQVRDAAGRRALDACHGRIVAIARIHDLLYRAKDYARVPFSAYLRALGDDLHKAVPVPGARIVLEYAIDEVALPLSAAIPCGLVLNEWITNALQHAFVARASGAVRVTLARQDDGQVRIGVADDGVGLPDGFDIQQCHSLGMQLVCALAKSLRAQVAVESGRGASFALTVPVAGSGAPTDGSPGRT